MLLIGSGYKNACDRSKVKGWECVFLYHFRLSRWLKGTDGNFLSLGLQHTSKLSAATLFSASFLWSRNHAWACQPVTRDSAYIFHDSAFLTILMSLFSEFLWVRAAVIVHSLEMFLSTHQQICTERHSYGINVPL